MAEIEQDEATDALEVLLELTRTLGAERSLQEALQATADAALELLPADHASVRLFDEGRRELLSTARAGTGSSAPPVTFFSGEGVLGYVADTGKAALVSNTTAEPRFSARPGAGFSVGSLVAVPMVAGAQVVGVLSASSPRTDVFTERDRDLAQLLANCGVPAIESARLAHLAITDDLTRAYNKRYLVSRLEEEVVRAERYGHGLAMLMMDLDRFKRVNDTYGHAVGDEVLREFVARVRAEVRAPDVLIRRGGEEFLLLMPSTSMDEAAAVAERIRSRVEQTPIDAEGSEVTVTVSIGVADFRAGQSAADLEGRADAAMYAAKDAGRNRIERG